MTATRTKHVLISGATSGIGKAAAEALAGLGYTVFAGALNDTLAEELRNEHISGIVPVVLDVSSDDSIDTAMRQITDIVGSGGYLCGLVNCAGVDFNAPLQSLEVREIRQMVNVNYLGSVLLTRAALALMKPGQSRVVFFSSATGLMPTPLVTIYSSTKTAIEGLADALRLELIPLGIKVAIIEPGVIRTPMTKAAPEVLEKMLARMTAEIRDLYEAPMRKIVKITINEKASSSTADTSRTIIKALTSPNPARRYQVGLDGKMSKIASHFPQAVKDWIQRKTIGI